MSQQTFDYVYSNAKMRLLTWVWETHGQAKWLRDFSLYVRVRADYEKRHIPHYVPDPNYTGD